MLLKQLHLFLLALILIPVYLQSQSPSMDCEQLLREAIFQYNLGRFHQIPKELLDCLNKNQLNRTDRQEAASLLTETYLFKREEELASQAYIALLKIDPYYPLAVENKSPELFHLYTKYKSWSVSFGLLAGFNASTPSILEDYTLPGVSLQNKKYKPGVRGHFGGFVGFDLFPGDQFEMVFEYIYMPRQYNYSTNLTIDDISGKLLVKESAFYSNALCYFRYHFNAFPKNSRWDNFSFYSFAGGGINWLQDSWLQKLKITFPGHSDLDATLTASSLGEFDMRQQKNVSIVGGLGIKYRITGTTFIIGELRYNLMLNNIVEGDNRSANPILTNTFYYIDDDKKLHTLAGSIGIMHYLKFRWRER